MAREKLADKTNNYWTSPKSHHQFVSTGCAGVDCILGGGFVLGRIANIVGDKSTSKTGMATECLINFCLTYKDGKAAYRDAEAAFDEPYAEAMGLPLKEIDFGDKPISTVEDLYRDLDKFLDARLKDKKPGIYILDSLDALSDEAEMERDIGESTYGGNKAKKMSELLRKLEDKIEAANTLFLVISQVRDNIGVSFGETKKRSGGKALDFYCSQIIWLAHTKTLEKTVKKVKRAYGIQVRAKVKKNKIGTPFRAFDFAFLFGFGIDDVGASIAWLEETGRVDALGEKNLDAYIKGLDSLDDETYAKERQRINSVFAAEWLDSEKDFLPKRKKYA